LVLLAERLQTDGHVGFGLLAILRKEYLNHGPADEFVDGVAELRRAESVHRKHGAGGVEHEVHRRSVLEQLAPLLLALAQCSGGALLILNIGA
jgi:hypothetical protein